MLMYPGDEYQAVVEYSPIQRTPLSAKVKVDGRQGTIEEGMTNFIQHIHIPSLDLIAHSSIKMIVESGLKSLAPCAHLIRTLPLSQPSAAIPSREVAISEAYRRLC